MSKSTYRYLSLALCTSLSMLALNACSKQDTSAAAPAAASPAAVAPASTPAMAGAPTAPAAASADTKPMTMAADMPMTQKPAAAPGTGATHHASGTVKAVDPVKSTVTLSHGPVSTLKWPAMTMTFKVKDKTLLDKLAADRKVDVDFTQEGTDYIVTSVK